MANEKNLRPPWKPGQSGNPSGRPKDPPGMSELRKLTRQTYKELVELMLLDKWDELAKIRANPKERPLKRLLASVLVQADRKGDIHALDKLLERVIGKVKEEVHVSGKPVVIEYGAESVELKMEESDKD